MDSDTKRRSRNDSTVTRRFGKDQYQKVVMLMTKLRQMDDREMKAVTSSETAFISYLIDMGIDSVKMIKQVK